jgi:thioredoxin-like negative regulator of GroEL
MTAASIEATVTAGRVREIADGVALSRVINDASHPALVLFGAAWSSPARRIEERLLRLFRGDDLAVVRVDVDHTPELARKFAVHAVPTLALFRSGQLAAKRLGDIADDDLQHWIEHECMMPCA